MTYYYIDLLYGFTFFISKTEEYHNNIQYYINCSRRIVNIEYSLTNYYQVIKKSYIYWSKISTIL